MPQLEFLNNLPVERVSNNQFSSMEEGSKSTTPIPPDEFEEFASKESKIAMFENPSLPQSETTLHNFEKESGSHSFQKVNPLNPSSRGHNTCSSWNQGGLTVTQN
jgi:hypothetical protein